MPRKRRRKPDPPDATPPTPGERPRPATRRRGFLLGLAIAVALIAIAAVWAIPRPIGDLYVGLAAGRDIMQGKLASPDEWSYLTGDRVWINQNWGTHLATYLAYRAAGETGILVLKFLMIAALAGFLTLAARARGVRAEVGALAAGGVVLAAHGYIDMRPNLTTLVMVPLLLWTLFLQRRHRHAAWASAAGVWLWANAHGGFLFGLGMLGLWTLLQVAFTAMREGLGPALRRHWPAAGATAGAILLAGLATPYPVENLVHPFVVAGSEVWRTVAEWRSVFDAGRFGTMREFWIVLAALVGLGAVRQAVALGRARKGRQAPPAARSAALVQVLIVTGILATVLLTGVGEHVRAREAVRDIEQMRRTALIFLALAAALAWALGVLSLRILPRDAAGAARADRPAALFQAALTVLAMSMAIRSRRFIPLAMVVSAPLIAGQLDWLAERLGRWRVTVALAAMLLVGAGLLIRREAWLYHPQNPTYQSERFFDRMHQVGEAFPARAADFLEANDLEGPVFQEWRWEGYLRWRVPELKLYVGGRAQQVYTEAEFLQRQALYAGRRGARPGLRLLAKHGVKYVIVPWDPTNRRLIRDALVPPDPWVTIYHDGRNMVLANPRLAASGQAIRLALEGELRYPGEPVATLSHAMAITSPAVAGQQPEQIHEALRRGAEALPNDAIYNRAGRLYELGRLSRGWLIDFLEREQRRLGNMKIAGPDAARILLARSQALGLLKSLYELTDRPRDLRRVVTEHRRIAARLDELVEQWRL